MWMLLLHNLFIAFLLTLLDCNYFVYMWNKTFRTGTHWKLCYFICVYPVKATMRGSERCSWITLQAAVYLSGGLLVWSGPANPAAWRRSPAASSSSWAETAAVGSPCWGSSPRWKGPPAPSASPRGRAQSAARPEARRGARPCRQSSVSLLKN